CPSDRGCPSSGAVQDSSSGTWYGIASYRPNNTSGTFINVPDDGPINRLSVQRNIMSITDGTSNTLLFGEFSNYDANWGSTYASYVGSSPSTSLSMGASVWSASGGI